MHHLLTTKLVLDVDDKPIEYSAPIAMSGYNTLQIDVTLFRLTGTNVTITFEGSNDMQNWRGGKGVTETITAEGYTLGTAWQNVATTYVRLVYEITGSTGQMAIAAAGVNLSLRN